MYTRFKAHKDLILSNPVIHENSEIKFSVHSVFPKHLELKVTYQSSECYIIDLSLVFYFRENYFCL